MTDGTINPTSHCINGIRHSDSPDTWKDTQTEEEERWNERNSGLHNDDPLLFFLNLFSSFLLFYI